VKNSQSYLKGIQSLVSAACKARSNSLLSLNYPPFYTISILAGMNLYVIFITKSITIIWLLHSHHWGLNLIKGLYDLLGLMHSQFIGLYYIAWVVFFHLIMSLLLLSSTSMIQMRHCHIGKEAIMIYFLKFLEIFKTLFML